MKKLPQIKDRIQLNNEFMQLKDELKNYSKKDPEKIPYGLLYTYYWLRAKTENKSFEEIVRSEG